MGLLLILSAYLILLDSSVCGLHYYVKSSDNQSCPHIIDRCDTLSFFTANSNLFLTTGTTLTFLPGVHTLNETMVIKDLSNLTMTVGTNQEAATILCSVNAGFTFINVSSLTLNGLILRQCGTEVSPTFFNETVSTYAKTFLKFSVNLQSAIFMNYITDLVLTNMTIANGIGYGLLGVNLLGDTLVSQVNFSKNNHHRLSDTSCFLNTSLLCKGGNMALLYTDLKECPIQPLQYSLNIEESTFEGGVDAGITFQPFTQQGILRNDVELVGGAGLGLILMQSSYGLNVNITNCTVVRNAAYVGANIYINMFDFVDNSSITITKTIMNHGNSYDQFKSILEVAGSYTMATGYFYMFGMVSFVPYSPVCVATKKYETNVFLVQDCELSFNEATLNSGGFMYSWPRSFLDYPRYITLNRVKATNNNGDATFINYYMAESRYGVNFKVFVNNCFFSGNFYRKLTNGLETSNPQMYQLNSVQHIEFNGCKWFNNTLSGIRSLQSIIHFKGTNEFIGNSAQNGGGLNIREGSIVYFNSNSTTIFRNNRAEQFGGAIFAQLVSYLCFYQINNIHNLPRIVFMANKAELAGDAVYANLENCLLQERVYASESLIIFLDISNFSDLDYTNSTSLISAPASQLCPCYNNTADCHSSNIIQVQIHPGQPFKLTFEARAYSSADLNNSYGLGLTPTEVTARVANNMTIARLDVLQFVQTISIGCSELTYTLYSPVIQVVEIVLSPQNNRLYTPVILNVTLLPCPVGFVLSTTSFKCVCDPILSKNGVICNSDTLTVVSGNDTWIGTFNSSNTTLVAYGECALKVYCNPKTITDLNLFNPDVQCSSHRSGVLCRQCERGYSTTVGSSNCLKCSNNYLAVLILFAVAPLFLLGFLTLFRVTVSTGRINAMLFYANIIRLTNFEFFSLENKEFVIFQVFINWINLDFGIETCFYDGFGIYAKSWLGFAFPIYLYIILAIIITSAHYSTKIARVLPQNMLAVVTTVILITFTKLIRASVVPLSLRTLQTNQGNFNVWLFDGSILYGSPKHLVLLLFSIFVLAFGIIPFAFLMFFYPFIWSFSSHEGTIFERIVCFVRSRLFKLKPLLETFDGPYRPKTRFWTGLLLLLRMVIYFTSVIIDAQNKGQVFKLATVTVVSIVLLGLVIAFNIYYCKINKRVEFVHLLNLAALQFTVLVLTLSNQSLHVQGYAISISVFFAFLIFVFTLLYENCHRMKPYYSKLRGKTFVDTRAQECGNVAQQRDRDFNDQNTKLDKEAIDQNEFLDVVDARNSVTTVSITNDKLEQLKKELMPN